MSASPEPSLPDPLATLLELSHDLGQAQRQLAILAEGNTSCRVDADSFLIKSSGSSLSTLTAADVTRCRFEPLLELLDQEQPSDDQITRALLASRQPEGAAESRKPSTEATFHAWLLTLPGVTHFAPLQRPALFNAVLLEWLETLGR